MFQIVGIVLPFLTVPYTTKILGADNLGVCAYTAAIINYFCMAADLGTNVYGIRTIAYNRDDKEKLNKVFTEIVTIRVMLNVLGAIMALVYILIFTEKYRIIFLLQMICFLSQIFDLAWFYQGIEEFKNIAIRNIVLKCIYVISIFLFIKSNSDLPKYVFIITFLMFGSSIVYWIGLKKYVKLDFKMKKGTILKHLKNSMHLFVPQIAIILYTSLDKVMLGSLVDKKYVSFYDMSLKFTMIGMIFITTFGTVMMPKISNLAANNNGDAIKEKTKESLEILTAIAIPMIFGLIAVSNGIVDLMLTEEFNEVGMLIKILSITIIFWTWNNVTGSQLLIPMKKEKLITISVVIGAVLNIILNIILIPRIQAAGCVVATLVTEAIVTGVQIYFCRNYFKIGLGSIWKTIVASIIMFAAIIFISNIFIQLLIGVIIYFFIMILLKDKYIFYGINKLRGSLKI